MSSPEPIADRGDEAGSTGEPLADRRAVGSAGSTVGTGSALGIGCLVALAIFVIVAIAARWLLGAW